MSPEMGPGLKPIYEQNLKDAVQNAVQIAGNPLSVSRLDHTLDSKECSRERICGSICWEPATEDPKKSATQADYKYVYVSDPQFFSLVFKRD
jgi:NAD(P)H-flavin reductase